MRQGAADQATYPLDLPSGFTRLSESGRPNSILLFLDFRDCHGVRQVSALLGWNFLVEVGILVFLIYNLLMVLIGI